MERASRGTVDVPELHWGLVRLAIENDVCYDLLFSPGIENCRPQTWFTLMLRYLSSQSGKVKTNPQRFYMFFKHLPILLPAQQFFSFCHPAFQTQDAEATVLVGRYCHQPMSMEWDNAVFSNRFLAGLCFFCHSLASSTMESTCFRSSPSQARKLSGTVW